jgi:hypothetical protein
MDKLKQRFEELANEAKAIEASKRSNYDPYEHRNVERIDSNALLNWTVKAKNLLIRTCGIDSQHFLHFTQEATEGGMFRIHLDNLRGMTAVFLAAKDDFEGGHLVSIRSLVQAEVFDSELEQASEFLKQGYLVAAAVTAGVVLETALRDLCVGNRIPTGKLDKMNADLAKAGVYNSLTQKKITALAAIRNSAAHGHPEQFQAHDVAAMISDVESFLAYHLPT